METRAVPITERPVETPIYKEWMKREGIPVYEALAGVEDICELPRGRWARLGGYGTFIELLGTKQDMKVTYVTEIPANGALEPERHLFTEAIYVLRGRGLTEVWHHGQPKRTFEWTEGSFFAIPLNVWHRFVNGGREPVLFYTQTDAPGFMQAFGNLDFIFNCDYNFTDRYSGANDYFVTQEKRYEIAYRVGGHRGFWETNFIPDLRVAFLGDHLSPFKVEGGRQTNIMMASGVSGHTSEWPVGKYHKAHYHGPGAILLGLRSEGYVLLWPKEYGIHPFQDGYGDKVVKVNWKPNAIYSPPHEWFHQHFNTGKESARHLAWFQGGAMIGLPRRVLFEAGKPAEYPTFREGGTLIPYEDEDPEIRRMFQEEVGKKGIEFSMPPVVYRTDPIGRELPPVRFI